MITLYLDTLLQSKNNFCVFFGVDDCRLHTLFTQFLYQKQGGKWLLYGSMGWLPANLHHIAKQRGYRLHQDPYFRDSHIEGGSMFEKWFVEPNPAEVARITEEIHFLATADEQYRVSVDAYQC